jgi:uncharacterized protein
MRKHGPINALISPIRMSILAATYGQPERWWYLSELAAFIGKGPSSLQREISSMARNGLLRTRKDGARSYFQAETESPLFEPLALLVERSVGIIEELRELLEPHSDLIELAFIYGSVARGEDHVQSDVDLIVIGDLGLVEIAPVLRQLELRFRREFSVKCYSPEEFRSKLGVRNHFVDSLLAEQKVFILGDENVLERLSGKRLS